MSEEEKDIKQEEKQEEPQKVTYFIQPDDMHIDVKLVFEPAKE